MVLLGGLVLACTATPQANERLCTPGANVFCRCVDRAEGTKRCNDDGQSFDECLPCDGSGDKGEGSGGHDGLGAGHGTDVADRDDDVSGSTKSTSAEVPTPVDAGSAKNTTENKPAPTKDAGTSTGGGGASSNSGSTSSTSFPDTPHCKPLKNVAPRIELQKLADVPNTAAGGKPADGLYVQSWVIEFTGGDGETGPSKHYSKETLEIMGDVGRFVFEDDDGKKAAGGFRLSAVSDNKIEVAYECPAAPPKELSYDATDSTLILYDPPYARVFYRQKEAK